jgi:hypothetical protein
VKIITPMNSTSSETMNVFEVMGWLQGTAGHGVARGKRFVACRMKEACRQLGPGLGSCAEQALMVPLLQCGAHEARRRSVHRVQAAMCTTYDLQ